MWLLPALAALLFLSGVSALVYQVAWLRLLSLTFGVTVHAASTVLATFMGGLAVGSWLAGRFADRARNPLRWFGFVELTIGACALCTPFALAAVHALYSATFSRLPDGVALHGLVRFVMAFLVLIVPTSMMGATLPFVVKSSLTRLEGLGTRVGLLYATNTAGAILGALTAGFYLVPRAGLQRSFLLAACLNAFVGCVAIAWSALGAVARGRVNASQPDQAADAVFELSLTVRRVVLAVFVVSGFASLALEVIWFRALVIFLGPTNFAFTVMLAAVLTGIAVGSFLITPLMPLKIDWLQVLATLQLGAGLVAIGSFAGLRREPNLPAWLQSAIEGAALGHIVPVAATSIVAILPTAIFFGLAFPIGLRLWAGVGGDARRTAERIGVFYALNVAGGIFGSIAAGFALMPLLASRGSLIFVAALFVASGLALQIAVGSRRPIMAVVAVAAVMLFIARAGDVPHITTFARFTGGRPLLWHEEGVQTTVSVVGEGGGGRMLLIDGRHQANDSASMVFIHRRIGLLPAVLHPNPKRALVVGLGGGATAGALSQVPGLQVDVVELSEGVIHAAAQFSHVNFDVLQQPSVNIRLDDGRNFLLRTRTPYDIITADAIIPTHAGANSLYSTEYFGLVRDALAADGIALHWNGGGSETEYGLILRAFVKAFPYTTLWGDAKLMLGSKQPFVLSRERIERMLADPAMRNVLTLMQVESFDHLARSFRADSAQIRSVLGEGPYLTDDKPLIEYFAPLPDAAAVDVKEFTPDIRSILQR